MILAVSVTVISGLAPPLGSGASSTVAVSWVGLSTVSPATSSPGAASVSGIVGPAV